MDVGQVESYFRTGEIPDAVKKALQQAAVLKRALVDADRQMNDRQQQINEITTEQNRIRENMKAVAQSSDYYQRLVKELDSQETQIQNLKTELKTLKQKREEQQKALEDYLTGVSVG
jgi:predicted  nucleic acid-binding Zn-ribbon protein